MQIFTPELLANFGLFGSLFVGLLVYVLKENTKREGQYRETINRLTKVLNTTLKEMCCDITEIKDLIKKNDE